MAPMGWLAAVPDGQLSHRLRCYDMDFLALGFGTRTGARRACFWGGVACVIESLRIILGLFLHLSVTDKPLDSAIAYFVGAAIALPVPLLIAGFRLVRGEGRLSGSIVIVLMTLDAALISAPPAATYFEMASYNEQIAIILRAMLFLLILNGVRGAFALHYSPRIAERSRSD